VTLRRRKGGWGRTERFQGKSSKNKAAVSFQLREYTRNVPG